MTPTEASPLGTKGAFGSLEELQARHFALVEQVGSEVLADENARLIAEFVDRSVATGKLLDADDDRAAAQGLINFWVARSSAALRAAKRSAETAATAKAIPNESRLRCDDALLLPFDATTIRSAIDEAGKLLARSSTEAALAKRVFLRLVRLRADNKTFDAVPVVRAALYDIDDSEKVNAIVEQFASIGILKVTKDLSPEMDRIVLRSPSLLNDWSTLKNWTNDRLGFRERANDWLSKTKPSDQLADGEILEDARRFQDRSSSEREYVNESLYRQKRQLEQAAMNRKLNVLLGLLVALAIFGWYGAYRNYARAKGERTEADTQRKAAEAQKEIATKSEEEIVRQRQFTDLRLFLRALAELATARTLEQWKLADCQWREWEKQIANDADYAHLRALNLKRLYDNATDPDSEYKVSAEDLAQIHELRDKLASGESVRRSMELARTRSFQLVAVSAQGVVAALSKGSRIGDAEPFIREFWIQYWGEMLLVERESEASAMVGFGSLLSKISAEVERPVGKLRSKYEALSNTYLKSSEKAIVGKVKRLNAAAISQMSRNGVISNESAERVTSILKDVAEQTVSVDLVTQLKAQLPLLLNALNKEKSQPLPSFGKNLKAS